MKRFNLESPPLIEAACFVEFKGGKKRDSTFPKRLHERIASHYPEQRKAKEDPNKPKQPSDKNPLRFHTVDESVGVNIGINRISINQLSPNLDWNQFKNHIEFIVDNCWKEASPASLESLALVYVNRIFTPGEPIHYDEFLNVHPSLPEGRRDLPWIDWEQRVSILPKNVEGVLVILSSADSLRKINDRRYVSLSLEMHHIDPQNVGRETILIWLDAAHAEIEKTFVDSLTTLSKAAIGYSEQ